MKQKVRELLLTTKVAQGWRDNFEEKVDELINLVTKVDTDVNVDQATEVLDVYKTPKKTGINRKRRKTATAEERPFEFTVFRN